MCHFKLSTALTLSMLLGASTSWAFDPTELLGKWRSTSIHCESGAPLSIPFDPIEYEMEFGSLKAVVKMKYVDSKKNDCLMTYGPAEYSVVSDVVTWTKASPLKLVCGKKSSDDSTVIEDLPLQVQGDSALMTKGPVVGPGEYCEPGDSVVYEFFRI